MKLSSKFINLIILLVTASFVSVHGSRRNIRRAGAEMSFHNVASVDDDYAVDMLKAWSEHRFDVAIPERRREIQNYHRPYPGDDLSMGGDPSTVAGRFLYERGFSTLAWTAHFEGIPEPFHYNLTMDLGYCNTSIRRSTDMGTYTFVNGTTSDSTRFDHMADDIRTLVNSSNTPDTRALNDHIVTQGLALLDDIDRGLAYIPKFCKARNQTTSQRLYNSSSIQATDTDPAYTSSIHDELRRKLLMIPHQLEQNEIQLPSDGDTDPSTPEHSPSTASNTASAVVATGVPALTGPTSHGYNFYLFIGLIGSGPVGGLGGLINELMWRWTDAESQTWKAVTGGAIGLILAFLYTAYFLGRPLTYGHFNGPGEASAAALARSREVVRPVAEQAGRRVGTATEATLMAAGLAILRRRARDTERRLSNLEREVSEGRSLPGSPFDVEMMGSFRGRIGSSWSRGTLGQINPSNTGISNASNPVTPGGLSAAEAGTVTGSGSGTSPGNTPGGVTGIAGTLGGPFAVNEGAGTSDTNYHGSAANFPATQQRSTCDLEDVAMRVAIGRSFLQGPEAYDDKALDDIPEDVLLDMLESQVRDNHGHCQKPDDDEDMNA